MGDEDEKKSEPKYITIEDFNKAMSARDSRFEKKMLAAIEKIGTSKAKSAAKVDDEPDAEDEADDDADEDTDVEETAAKVAAAKSKVAKAKTAGAPSPEILALQRNQRSLERRLREEKEARTKAENDKKMGEERELIQKMCAKYGVKPELQSALMAQLHTVEKKITRAEDGAIVWRDGDDDLPAEEGLDKFFGSATGKSFLAPKGIGGTGSRLAGQNGKAGVSQDNGQASPQELDNALMDLASGLMGFPPLNR